MEALNYTFLFLGDKILGTNVVQWMNQIRLMNSWTKKEIKAWQNDKLQKLITHAYENVNYYKRFFDENSLKPADINDISRLELLPVLTKEIIRNHYNDLRSNNVNNYKHKKSATGGSTAEPLVFLRDYDSWSYSAANSIIYWNKVGYNLGNKFASFGSSTIIPGEKMSIKHHLFYKLKGKISLPAITFTNDTVKKYFNIIQQEKITFLYGYASALYLIAKYVIENKLELNIKGCISTSELLLQEYRETIENAFNCNVLDAYGAGDGGITAFNYNNYFFEVGYNCIIEVDRVNDKRLLVTDLLNYSMPFIRYEIGDAAEINEDTKDCNYNGQIINSLYGRVPNILKFANNKEVIAPAFTVLFSNLNVNAFRFIKKSDTSLDVELIRGNDFSTTDESEIIKSIKYHLGEEVVINICYKDNFDLQNSGKRNYFISN